MILINNIARNCTIGFKGNGGFSSSSDYNSSNISGEAPVQSPRVNTNSPWYSGATTDANIFIDAPNNDYHLKGRNTIMTSVGTNLTSDGSCPFSDDIDGETRPKGSAAWDLGADEIVRQLWANSGVDQLCVRKGTIQIMNLS
jgi:hypothetical protein